MNNVLLNTSFEFAKTFSENDVNVFAGISEDKNPIHLDEEYASKSIFGKRVVHGILLISMFSKIFGTIYPGEGGIYLSQSVKFTKPVFLDEEIIAKVTLTNFDSSKMQGIFTTNCYNSKGDIVIAGEAKVLFPARFKL